MSTLMRKLLPRMKTLPVTWRSMTAATDGAETSPSPSPLQMVPQEAGKGPTSPSRAGERCAYAVWKGAQISPRKLNLVAALVRGLGLEDAKIQCNLLPKKAAKMVEKVLLSATANAVHNHGLEKEKLYVKEAFVGKGTYLKRVSIHGRGRAGVMHKKRAHLTVVLEEAEEAQKLKIKLLKPANERPRKGFEITKEDSKQPPA